MKVLVIGGGGREHCLAWSLARSKSVSEVFCAPGNGGIEDVATCIDLDARDTSSLVDFARERKIDLVIPGPEQPLVEGIVDAMLDNGIRAFGPTKKAARLEGSKVFAKSLMSRYGIPTARFDVFTNHQSALKFADMIGYPVVVKADGLAAGKGAVVCRDAEETQKALAEFMLEGKIGAAGETVVVEEFLEGSEISILAIVSGSDILVLPTAQDHKQALDGDDGPNTGGMGAYSPCLHVTEAELVSIERDIIIQTIHAMAIEGSPYTGVLYAGLMLTPKGPHVLEFNCRLGDPETQAIFPRFKGDLGLLLKGAVEGKLAESYDEDCWDPRHAVSVVMASEGYPGQYRKGLPITGLTGNYPPDVHVFHCGTRKTKSGEYLTTGGRVVSVTALGVTLTDARARAYATVNAIEFQGAHYRTDIGRRERKQ